MKHRNLYMLFILLSLGSLIKLYAQADTAFRVVFWNVENLFDAHNDSLKNDDEFLPGSIRAWHYGRYKKKTQDISRAIAAMGKWHPPALIGLCEIENDTVMRYLTRYSPLKALGYRYVMTDSPDQRGIDVALMYQRDQFKLISFHAVPVSLVNKKFRPTRDILHVTGLIATGDTLDVFVCHFPSRSQGKRETDPYRKHVAGKLRDYIDSLSLYRNEPRIVVMGDLNMERQDRILSVTMGVRSPTERPEPDVLYWLHSKINGTKGSYKYRGKWETIDHIILSGLLLDKSQPFYVVNSGIIDLPFLLIDDIKYGGKQPNRTYYGMKYQGGFSDHLPVFADFVIKRR